MRELQCLEAPFEAKSGPSQSIHQGTVTPAPPALPIDEIKDLAAIAAVPAGAAALLTACGGGGGGGGGSFAGLAAPSTTTKTADATQPRFRS